jgi:hypothetical protein
MTEHPFRAGGLEHVTALAEAAAKAPVGADVHAEGRRRFVHAAQTVVPRSASRSLLPRLFLAAAVLLVALGVGLFVRDRPLTYEIRGSSGEGARYVRAGQTTDAEVLFSDGSDVTARPGTRLRVEETSRDGARVLMERGSLTASVVHREHSSWLFVAGPFEVHVTGTKLTIAWDPEKEEIDVTLHEGSVEVESPFGPSRHSVRAGHRLHGSVVERTMTMDGEARTPETVATAEAMLPPAPPTPESHERRPSAATPVVTSAPAVEREESWPELVRKGAFSAVVQSAKGRGLSQCLDACGAADLRALADAARYVGDADTAKRSLSSLRARFRQSRQGAAAAFLLGRTDESTGGTEEADRWYRTYLAESPTGEFAADARAGRERIARKHQGPN